MKAENKKILLAYLELTKPRILTLVLITTTLGFFLSGDGITSLSQLLILLVGAAFVCAGSSTLNHYLEREADSKMFRTCHRPIPSGIISPSRALSFGIVLVLSGVLILCWGINLLTAFLSLLSAFLYVLVYTPLKKISWVNTSIGAIAGALPPMGGWAAASGELTLGAWVLFFILFLWQHPHFYAIAWMFKDDYKRAGFKMLPVVYPDGISTFQQINLCSLLLIPISLLPTYLGISGWLYFYGSLFLGIGLFGIGRKLSFSKSMRDAQHLLHASVIYLPVLLFFIIIDRIV